VADMKLVERLISRLAGKPFDAMDGSEQLQWGFMLSWCMCFNVLPAAALAYWLVFK
jgi:hypothetical protein